MISTPTKRRRSLLKIIVHLPETKKTNTMAMWNPWRGCHKFSEGCRFCYIHKGDAKRGVDTNNVVKTDHFFAPLETYKRGVHKDEYKMKAGSVVYLCFSSDFLLKDADAWRDECWKMIKQRSDLHFVFLTKRIERFMNCIPDDWNDGYENVTVGCTIENQAIANHRLAIFDTLPIKHKNIICQPMIDRIDLSGHLNGVELVLVGGESDRNARPLYYEWVLDIKNQCVNSGVRFDFRQTGTNFVKEGKWYKINAYQQGVQARKAGINTKIVS